MRRAVLLSLLGCWLAALAAFRPAGPLPRPYPFPSLPFFPPMPVAESNPVTVEGAALGRYLFYDPVLSADSTMACASCHRQEAAFSDAPNPFSKDRSGAPLRRNTPPLFNLAWYPRLFWDGRAASVEEQALHPVRAHEEMNLQWPDVVRRLRRNGAYANMFRAAFGEVPIDSGLITKAIAQFERTLLSYRSKYDRVLAGEASFTDEEYSGFDIANDMAKGGCLHCHSTDADALGVVPSFSNNGLDTAGRPEAFRDGGYGAINHNAADYGKFKTPSLRNVALTAPYMHDGRFRTLGEVLRFYSEGVQRSVSIDSKMEYVHQGGVRLSAEDRGKVIAFLNTLTDSAFVTDPAFANPFKSRAPR